VRLGSCVAIELALGVAVAAGVGAAGFLGVSELRSQWEREAEAARIASQPITWNETTSLRPAGSRLTVFDGVSDERLLAPLRTGEVTRVKFNSGGSSISLRLELDNGARAAFKPMQTNWQTVPRKEVAAYRINRLLGLSTVPPAIGRMFRIEDLFDHVDPAHAYVLPRLRAEILHTDGWVAGELSWWIPEIGSATIDDFRIDSVEGIVSWKRYLTVDAPVPYRERLMVAQISDMVVFDFVINNMDRWSGGNARTSSDGNTLYFMDNTLSFGRQRDGHEKVRVYLERVQKFSRSLVESLRNLRDADVRDALSVDTGPFDELLDDNEIDALLARRDYVIAYIDGLIAQHGEENVLVFP
jgi:hypothetical protein